MNYERFDLIMELKKDIRKNLKIIEDVKDIPNYRNNYYYTLLIETKIGEINRLEAKIKEIKDKILIYYDINKKQQVFKQIIILEKQLNEVIDVAKMYNEDIEFLTKKLRFFQNLYMEMNTKIEQKSERGVE